MSVGEIVYDVSVVVFVFVVSVELNADGFCSFCFICYVFLFMLVAPLVFSAL